MKAIHIFRAGTHRTASGEAICFSEADICATIAAYDPQLHEAPIVVGHPAHDAPAYGWVKSLSNEPNSKQTGICAQLGQVDTQFAEMVQAGRFKKISAAFYAPHSPNNPKQGVYYLRHVGFLGAMPPAIKGLKPVQFHQSVFHQGEEVVFEFSESINPNLWQRLKDWLRSQYGEEAAKEAQAQLEALENEGGNESGRGEADKNAADNVNTANTADNGTEDNPRDSAGTPESVAEVAQAAGEQAAEVAATAAADAAVKAASAAIIDAGQDAKEVENLTDAVKQAVSDAVNEAVEDAVTEAVAQSLAQDAAFSEIRKSSRNLSSRNPNSSKDKPRGSNGAQPFAAKNGLAAENHRLRQQLAQQQRHQQQAKQAQVHADHLAFAESLVAQGVRPAYVAPIVAALDAVNSPATALTFGEGGEKRPLSEGLREVFSSLVANLSTNAAVNPAGRSVLSFSEQASLSRAPKGSSVNPLIADAQARQSPLRR